MSLCRGPVCSEKVVAKGLCSAHYKQLQRDGVLHAIEKSKLPEDKFWKNIRRDGIRKIIGQETLSCLALILSAGRVNRHPVIARFKEARVTVGQYRILQRFTGCRMSEFIEAAQRFETLFQINFIADVFFLLILVLLVFVF